MWDVCSDVFRDIRDKGHLTRFGSSYLEPEPGLLTYKSLLLDLNGGMIYQMTLKLVQMKQVLVTN